MDYEDTPLLNNIKSEKNEKVRPFSNHLFDTHALNISSRFQSLSGVCLLVSVVGCTYAYGSFSPLLQSKLGYEQQTLDLIASVGNTGLYFSFMVGVATERLGFKTVVFVGGILIFTGYFYIWLALMERAPANVYSVAAFYLIAQVGVCCHIASSVAMAVKLFPKEARGAAIGLVKGYFGLSSAVIAILGGGLFLSEKDGDQFVLFIALFIPITGIDQLLFSFTNSN